MQKKEKTFSLKDQLFNPTNIAFLASILQAAHPPFDAAAFQTQILTKLPQLELMEVVTAITQAFTELLPSDFRTTRKILLTSLNDLPSDHRGGFIYAGHAQYIEVHGCNPKHLDASLEALGQITSHFSAEFAIRRFINEFPDQTIAKMTEWSQSQDPNKRRLASEGLRPKLPWAKKITSDPLKALPILDNLYSDQERFITRSVANHLNDITKINPDLAVEKLAQWKNENKQNPQEMTYIINHSLRTAIKRGHPTTLAFLGFNPTPAITLSNFTIPHPIIQIGDSLTFNLTLTAQQTENLIIDFKVTYANPRNRLSQKVFKLKTLTLEKDQSTTLSKSHPFRPMTTKTLYPGQHTLEIQINGKIWASLPFTLLIP